MFIVLVMKFLSNLDIIKLTFVILVIIFYYNSDIIKLVFKIMEKFIGRKKELKQLNGLLKKNTASLVVIKGRRRIGKSRLIEEFGKQFKFYSFSGVPPTENTTNLKQMYEFGWQLGKALLEPAFKDDDWNDLFLRLSNRTREGRTIILLDEISWIGSKDPDFLGKLKNAWDLEFKKNNKLILILCGSVSSWIDKNILSSTGFLGRISMQITLEELNLKECNEFWDKDSGISAFEKCKILSVIGGIPKYLEEIRKDITAEDNIKNLCFSSSGMLFNEFEHIFTDIFSKRSEIYKKIVQSISEGSFEPNAIYKNLGYSKGGVLSNYLEDLVSCGFVSRDYTWHISSNRVSKLSKFRIKDNYLRFYLKYILPNKDQIRRNVFENKSISSLANFNSIMGLQFENIVISNRELILDILGIRLENVIYDNPFFQPKNKLQPGCQIDYMIQTRFNSIYICEMKFSKHPIEISIIEEVKQKIKNLKLPKAYSYRPVLIHINGVAESVKDSNYFAEIIDISKFLDS
jgi:AAA+ ATPase superfamily predicted ATPase